ncbi:hypothetical protein KP05_08485 [Cobetia amphilecti]|nr:hypothetical protein KP05_08485 [Cobetia amphilecti]
MRRQSRPRALSGSGSSDCVAETEVAESGEEDAESDEAIRYLHSIKHGDGASLRRALASVK